jgi:hypothetical protein
MGTDFAAAPSAGTGGGGTFSPTMFGDLLGTGARVVRSTSVGGTTTRTFVPLLSAGGFKISDNGSPRPQDRIYLTYNYFNDANAGDTKFDYNRVVFGFEKTFLDGNASVGLRLPFGQGDPSGFGQGSMGDLSLYGIYAFINDRQTGNVLSTGLVVTIPTGPSFNDDRGVDQNGWIFQPFLGYVFNHGDFFVQGFSSGIFAERQTAISNDVAVGYWFGRSNEGMIRGIIPTVELHLYTPLDHTDASSNSIFADNILTVTTGVTFVIGERTTVGLAIGVPISGPKPDSWEGIATLNWRF